MPFIVRLPPSRHAESGFLVQYFPLMVRPAGRQAGRHDRTTEEIHELTATLKNETPALESDERAGGNLVPLMFAVAEETCKQNPFTKRRI